MNGLAGSDPLTTQHSSDGGGNCILAFSVLAQGQVTSPAYPFMGAGLLCKSGLMEVSLKVAHEGRRVTACSGLLSCLSPSWALQACLMLPQYLSREGKCSLGEGRFNFL